MALAVIDILASPDRFRVEEQFGFPPRRAHQRHIAMFQQGMAAADPTPTQSTALVKVVELGKVSQNLLGRLAATDPAAIQGVVRRLIARGLIVCARLTRSTGEPWRLPRPPPGAI